MYIDKKKLEKKNRIMFGAFYTLMCHGAFCVLFLNVCRIRTAGGVPVPVPGSRVWVLWSTDPGTWPTSHVDNVKANIGWVHLKLSINQRTFVMHTPETLPQRLPIHRLRSQCPTARPGPMPAVSGKCWNTWQSFFGIIPVAQAPLSTVYEGAGCSVVVLEAQLNWLD